MYLFLLLLSPLTFPHTSDWRTFQHILGSPEMFLLHRKTVSDSVQVRPTDGEWTCSVWCYHVKQFSHTLFSFSRLNLWAAWNGFRVDTTGGSDNKRKSMYSIYICIYPRKIGPFNKEIEKLDMRSKVVYTWPVFRQLHITLHSPWAEETNIQPLSVTSLTLYIPKFTIAKDYWTLGRFWWCSSESKKISS